MTKETFDSESSAEPVTLEEALKNLSYHTLHIGKLRKERTDELKALHSRLQDEIDKLLQSFINGLVNKEDYIRNYKELSEKRLAAIQNINKYDNADDEYAVLMIIRLLEDIYAKAR